MRETTQKALNLLRRMIEDGNIGRDGFLPPERELCDQLRIGRGALRAILQELTTDKLIRPVAGKGMRINESFGGSEAFRKFLTIIPHGALRAAEQIHILRGIAAAAEDRAAEMVLFFNRDAFIGTRLSSRIVSGGFDGVIFLESFPPEMREQLCEFPILSIVANLEEDVVFPAVRIDYRQVGRLAGRYLVEHGHRNIGFLSGIGTRLIFRDMRAGIKGALAEDDLVLNDEYSMEIAPDDFDGVGRQELLRRLANREHCPTAFVTGRDSRARLIFECCAELNLRIPEDVSVIGYDDLTWEDASRNNLTTIAQPAYETGYCALQELFDAVTEKRPVRSIALDGRLLERASVRNMNS